MARTPDTVNVGLHELMQLLQFKWTAVNCENIGELGPKDYESMIQDMNAQSQIELKPAQLADLVHHMKEVIFEKVPLLPPSTQLKNHNRIMRRLKATAPNLFKELATGEVVMVDLEEKSFE